MDANDCIKFHTTGDCQYGDACLFKHGEKKIAHNEHPQEVHQESTEITVTTAMVTQDHPDDTKTTVDSAQDAQHPSVNTNNITVVKFVHGPDPRIPIETLAITKSSTPTRRIITNTRLGLLTNVNFVIVSDTSPAIVGVTISIKETRTILGDVSSNHTHVEKVADPRD